MITDHKLQTPDPDMTDSKMDEVKDDRKLKGKTNFISWKREFERAAKVNDIFEYLTGEEVVLFHVPRAAECGSLAGYTFVRSDTDAKAQETPRSSFDYSPTPR